MTFSETNKEKHLRRIKSTVTQSQVQESNDGHPLGKMLSGKMLAPSPAFQKALLGILCWDLCRDFRDVDASQNGENCQQHLKLSLILSPTSPIRLQRSSPTSTNCHLHG